MTKARATFRPASRQGLSLAYGLGWFSLGLGLAELALPRTLSRRLGLRPALVAGYGLREVAVGLGILLGDDPAPWIQARIAGDVLDLATLAVPLATQPGRRAADVAALLAVAGPTVLDLLCASRLDALPDPR